MDKYYIVDVFRNLREANMALRDLASKLDLLEAKPNHKVYLQGLRIEYEDVINGKPKLVIRRFMSGNIPHAFRGIICHEYHDMGASYKYWGDIEIELKYGQLRARSH